MLKEAADATKKDLKKVKSTYETREEVTKVLVSLHACKKTSVFFDSYREKALELIESQVEYNGVGSRVIPPWIQIARLALGTDNFEKAIIGLVVLGDIRGLPSFQKTLLMLSESEEDSIEDLILKFNKIRLT